MYLFLFVYIITVLQSCKESYQIIMYEFVEYLSCVMYMT